MLTSSFREINNYVTDSYEVIYGRKYPSFQKVKFVCVETHQNACGKYDGRILKK